MENDPLRPRIVESDDGSHTLRVDALNEHYHSHKGALQESNYVFLKMGLELFNERDHIRILEVGFGTGLNALLTALSTKGPSVHYVALETHPLELDLVRQLNYPMTVPGDQVETLFEAIHQAPWNQPLAINDRFTIEKRETALQDLPPIDLVDLVYFDAFAPHAQPELWEPAIWIALIERINAKGVLVTYCAKGQVRRDMQAAGFIVERLEGPPGKREMLRATKP
ncbi:MAG: tRNA (5-methylaminomethyl-2-thiouridine)(34)-methyltransferase MnmD [Flavobacteriales bacterium]|nr:tRNA (5-methylaminomethyl-2-thiouridine)(34)-methyltransferase MnmD [Flavobacteriales bacterium]